MPRTAIPFIALVRRAFPGLILVLAAVSSGCGPGTTRVEGKVTHQGKAVVYGSVVLVAGDGVPYTGELKPDGSFTIDGVPVGEVRVGVTSPNPNLLAGRKGNGKGFGGPTRADRMAPPPPDEVIKAWFAIPEKFTDPIKSGVTAMVESGKPLQIDLP